jgi:AraC family transcriptional regulator of adaptative response/methylated-DNA-[protein]-cysteine methyltransferase
MLAIGNEEALVLLEFMDRPGLEREVARLEAQTTSDIIPGMTASLESIEKELSAYFSGTLQQFTTPLLFLGTPFQKRVWEELKKISLGETRSYLAIAKAIEQPTAFRAVALANRANQLAIIVPCHRVIQTNGKLGGYAGGILRKQTLLDLEQQHI